MSIVSNRIKANKLLIATHNVGKFSEIKKQLGPLGLELVSLVDLGIEDDVEEKGDKFEDIVRDKAEFYYKLSQIPTLATDGGMEVDVLGGEPGVKSRRWPGHRASDEELLQFLLDKLEGIPIEKRTARFVETIAIHDGKKIKIFRGECRGKIGLESACELKPGLPWSSIFYPDGYDKVFSQLTPEEKNEVSHRGNAIKKLIKYFNEDQL